MGLPAPRLEIVSLAAIVRRVAKLETRVAVTVKTESDLVIRADPDQLAQALINLVKNAAEASLSPDVAQFLDLPSHDEYRSQSMQRHEPQVELGWELAFGEVLINVVDNGPGLTNAGNLFVPFYTTKPGGTGIGLVLAQQIAMAHSGSVQLVNRADAHGCCACLRIPIHATASVAE
jgi:signal transduction histidine kinase